MRVTRDDERARRVCSLALEFMSARAPVSSSDVARGFYADLSADSFRKAFARDRAVLAACGLSVVEVGRAEGETAWGIDERRSYAEGVELSAGEAGALEIACQGLLDDPTFPLAEDLRLALAKVARAFSDVPALVASSGRHDGGALPAVARALVEGRGLGVTYTDALGSSSRRRLAPYGVFGLRGALYLVADELDGADEPTGAPRTYRLDRFGEVRVLEGVPCEVPRDFSVLDWRRLPFQLGPSQRPLTLAVPEDRAEAVREASLGQGSLSREGGRVLWRVDGCDLDAAASWAVSQGLEPIDPPELVSAWERVLRGVVGDVS